MFTGIISTTALVKEFRHENKGGAVLVCEGKNLPVLKLGDSVAVNGCCLTLTALQDSTMSFDLSSETIAKTNFSKISKQSLLNIEFPMRPTDFFGGHIVTGHVDGLAIVDSVEKNSGSWTMWLHLVDQKFEKYCVEKGSLTLNGVSLTVNEIKAHEKHESLRFDLIPETLTRTNLESVQVGTILNVEVDILAKHLEKLVKSTLGRA